MAHTGRKKESGFTLLEVLVSLTILSVGLLALALLQTTAIKGNTTAAKNMIAMQIAQDQLEWFRRQPWASIVSSNPSMDAAWTSANVYATLPDNPGGDTVERSGTSFYRAWRVVTSGTLRVITVWVCWQDDRGNWHNVMLPTERANIL